MAVLFTILLFQMLYNGYIKRERERDREREREKEGRRGREREADRHADKQKQSDRNTGRRVGGCRYRQVDRGAEHWHRPTETALALFP